MKEELTCNIKENFNILKKNVTVAINSLNIKDTPNKKKEHQIEDFELVKIEGSRLPKVGKYEYETQSFKLFFFTKLTLSILVRNLIYNSLRSKKFIEDNANHFKDYYIKSNIGKEYNNRDIYEYYIEILRYKGTGKFSYTPTELGTKKVNIHIEITKSLIGILPSSSFSRKQKLFSEEIEPMFDSYKRFTIGKILVKEIKKEFQSENGLSFYEIFNKSKKPARLIFESSKCLAQYKYLKSIFSVDKNMPNDNSLNNLGDDNDYANYDI